MRSQKWSPVKKWSALQISIGNFAVVILGAIVSGAQSFDSNLWKPVRWRLVGPARGGRTLAVSGVAGNPDVYYMGTVAGGVWKTTNAGELEPIDGHDGDSFNWRDRRGAFGCKYYLRRHG